MVVPSPLYFSRPDIVHPHLSIRHAIPSPLDHHSFIFVAPISALDNDTDAQQQSGPLILDRQGDLIWCGAAEVGSVSSTTTFDLCEWEGDPALCLFRGQKRSAVGYGQGVVLDRHYQEIAVIDADDGPIDLHEFRTSPSGTVLFTTYRPWPYDLGLDHGVGWVLDSGFGEIDLRQRGRSASFTWNALTHFNISESAIPLRSYPEIFGSGRSHRDAFDFFHINSVDKDDHGNYLISARHTDSVYLISGKDGTVLWQLGGKNSWFHGPGAEFRRQHHARYRSGNGSHTLITLFDNTSDGYSLIGSESRGVEISLNHYTMAATVQRQFTAFQPGGLLAHGMGSLQMGSNGEAMACFGSNATITIFDRNNQAMLDASFDDRFLLYRASVHSWSGSPRRPPNVWAYARTPHSAIHVYVSWNGASGVEFWNFYVADEPGSYRLAGTKQRTGFETNFTCDINAGQASLVIAEAVGYDGARRNSSPSSPFMPPENLASQCGEAHCFTQSTFNYRLRSSSSTTLRGPESPVQGGCAKSSLPGLRLRLAQAMAAGLFLMLVYMIGRRYWTTQRRYQDGNCNITY
ncbi:hypothetical protein AC578_8328 [Pseudocercospora eumusae]|uniref:ASST-domain-containing protein n=1 Tax=Pseudocercospora eumusae TaxID=321146 RepID=A0A139GWF9_9PEZI|nr:hypothetical protein AC578_8328 [Pseudocercospora eumusae]